MGDSTCIVLNPAAHFHATGRAWQSSQQACLRALAPVEIILVKDAREAEEAAHRGALRGFEKIVAVGGSETAHGVLNGLMRLAEVHRKALKVGFLSVDRPHPWSRTLGLPRALDRQLEILRAGNTLPFDVGRLECLGFDGQPLTRYFLNGAAFGLTSRLLRDWQAAPDAVFRRIEAIVRALVLALRHRDPWVYLEREGEALYRGPWLAGMVMVGRYYPRLGRVAPDADPGDGLLDLVGLAGPFRISALTHLAGLGRPGGLPGWTTGQGRIFRASEMTTPICLEADGLPTGTLPATFEVVPRALPVMVAAVPARSLKPRFGRLAEIDRRSAVAGNLKFGSAP